VVVVVKPSNRLRIRYNSPKFFLHPLEHPAP